MVKSLVAPLRERRGLWKRIHTADSPGQALVETAIAAPLMVLMFSVLVGAGQLIGYSDGLTSAAAAGAAAAAHAAAKSGDTTQAAVAAVNQEQGVTSWTACGSANAAPCVSVAGSTRTTGSGSGLTIEEVVLHGSFSPTVNPVGVAIPVTINAGASV